MRQLAPGKTLIEAPTAGNSATCKSCAHCPWMAMNALQGVVDCLETRQRRDPRATSRCAAQALGCIDRMLDFVKAATRPSVAQPKPAASCRTSARPERASVPDVRPQRNAASRRASATSATRCSKTSAAATGPASWCPPAGACRPACSCAKTPCCAAATGSKAACGARPARRASTGTTPKAPTDAGRHAWSARIEADARALLTAERPALNFLQLLSGTATTTRRHVRRDRRRLAQPARLRHSRHPQDPARPAPGAEVRGARRRRRRTSAWRCGTAS